MTPIFRTAAPVPIVSLYLAAVLHGRRGVAKHLAGMVVAGSLLLLWLSVFHGPLGGILAHYRTDMPMLFGALPGPRKETGSVSWSNFGPGRRGHPDDPRRARDRAA